MNKTTFRIVFIIVSLLGLITGQYIVKALYKPSLTASDNCIIKTITDEHGLTSVVYRQNGQEWGLDYLTPKELDSLKQVLR